MMRPELAPTPSNIARVADVETPIEHGDHKSMRLYRAAGDLIRANGECVVNEVVKDCTYGCTNSSSLCGRYMSVLAEVSINEIEVRIPDGTAN